MYLNAGELDQRITVQARANDTPDGHGQATAAWVNVLTDIAAKVDTRPGQDLVAAAQEQATLPVTFRIRYRTTINDRMRVLWRGQVYELLGQPINVRGANVALDLPCIAGLSEGR